MRNIDTPLTHEGLNENEKQTKISRRRESVQSLSNFFAERAESYYAPLNNNEKAEVTALMMETRPGIIPTYFKEGDYNKFKSLCDKLGLNVMIIEDIAPGQDQKLPRKIIINTDVLQERIDREPELAKEVGWNTSNTFEHNIQQASAYTNAPTKHQALMGFILGFPISSIHGYSRERELKKAGAPPPSDLLRLGVVVRAIRGGKDIEKSLDPSMSQITQNYLRKTLSKNSNVEIEEEMLWATVEDERKQNTEKTINKSNNLSQAEKNKQGRILWRGLIKKTEPLLRKIFKEGFNQNDDNIDFMLSSEIYTIPDQNNNTAFTFKVYNHPKYGGSDAIDVKNLEAHHNQTESEISDSIKQ